MSKWIDGEKGPQCICGNPTQVILDKTLSPLLLCFFHTKSEGSIWCLPKEKPENWPNLNNDEIEILVNSAYDEVNNDLSR